MARRIRRFKRRQLWLPVLGNRVTLNEGVPVQGSSSFGENALLTSSEEEGITWEAFPLTYDQGVDPEYISPLFTPNPFTLRDRVAGNEWHLRRAVGKVVCGVVAAQGSPANRAQQVECGFGLIVCNTDDDGTPLTDFNEVNPLAGVSMEDPWIFHRTWLLGTVSGARLQRDNGTDTALSVPEATAMLPMHNTQMGSVMDGPHVDQKTARRIHRSERLYGVYAQRVLANPLEPDPPVRDAGTVTTYCYARLRLLGNIRSAMGNRGNASR